jgi:hypothetical protein
MADNDESKGETRLAGEGLSDDEMVRQVASQTDSELKYQDFFEREADGVMTDTEAAKATADELIDDAPERGRVGQVQEGDGSPNNPQAHTPDPDEPNDFQLTPVSDQT